jgi:hypothetical protein
MNGVNVVGSLITDQTLLNQLKEQLISSEEFKTIEKEFKGIVDLNNSRLVEGFAFDALKGSNLTVSKGLTVLFDEKLIVTYQEFVREDKPGTLVIVKHIEGEKLTQYKISGSLKKKENSQELTEEDRKELDQMYVKTGFNFNEVYVPGMLGEISAQGWPYEGCVWGGYKWCGKGCNNYPENGGDNTYINATDLCCRVHDYCYKNNTYTEKVCDDRLCSCVATHTTGAAAIIRLAFFC